MSKKSFQPEDMKRLGYLSAVTVSADGSMAACVLTRGDMDSGRFTGEILLADLGSGKTRILSKAEGANCTQPQFSGGRLYYLSDESGENQLYSRNLSDGSTACHTTARHGINRYSLSADGRYAAVEMDLWPEDIAENKAFQTMTPQEKTEWEREISYRPVEITDLTYKMDDWYGMRRGELPQVATVDLSNGEQTLAVSDQLEAVYPVLSADGSRLAFYGYPYKGAFGRQPELFLCERDGSGRRQLTGQKTVYIDGHPAFTGKGDEILFTGTPSFADGSSLVLLYAVDIKTGEIRNVIGDNEDEICHGIHAFVTGRTEYGKPMRSFHEDAESGDIYFVSSFRGRENIYKKNLYDLQEPVTLAEEGKNAIHEFAMADGGRMVCLMADLERPAELYEKKTGEAAERLTRVNDWLLEYELPQTEEFWIPTKDGKSSLQVWLMHPQDQQPGKRYPAVLYIHGGPETTYNAEYWHEFHALADAGMAVIFTNPRGSWGYGRAFCAGGISWAPEAMDDLLSAVDACVEKGFIDPERIGITGGSYGGYMTNKFIGRTSRFAAAVSQRCLINPLTSYGTGDMGFISADPDAVGVKMLDYLEDRTRGNALTYIDRMKTPLLLLHGYRDYRCSFEQAEQLFIAMKDRNPEVPVRLVMFPEENHGVDRTGKLYNQIRHLQEMRDWFCTYLAEGGAENE